MEIRKLNTLRGIAALIVVVSHYSNTTLLFDGYLGYGAGQFGVMLFFLLSGFLMSYLYLSTPFSRQQVGQYVVARLARIAPLFVAVVLVSYMLQSIGISGLLYEVNSSQQLVLHLFFISGVNVLWTIPPEVQFYTLFVFLWWLSSKHWLGLWGGVVVCFATIYALGFPLIRLRLLETPMNLHLLQALPYFFVGVALGKLYKHWQPPERLKTQWYVLALLLIPLLYPKIYQLFWPDGHRLWQDVQVLAVISGVFFLITFFVPNGSAILSNTLGDFLGKLSYSLYLLHLPVLHLLAPQAMGAPLLYFPVFLFFAFVVAYLSYVFLENPSRTFLRKLPTLRRRNYLRLWWGGGVK